MGTSNYQRSPSTPAWEHVRDAYRAGTRDPAEVSRRVVLALAPQTRELMAGPGVATCLRTLLDGARAAAQHPVEAPLRNATSVLTAAGALRSEADRRLALGGHASTYCAIALDALGASAVMALSPATGPDLPNALAPLPLARLADTYRHGHLHALTQRFIVADMDRCLSYFVSRDLSQFVGTDSFPTVSDARRLTSDVGFYAGRVASAVPLTGYEDRLQAALSSEQAQGRVHGVHDILGEAFRESLDAIQGGGRPEDADPVAGSPSEGPD